MATAATLTVRRILCLIRLSCRHSSMNGREAVCACTLHCPPLQGAARLAATTSLVHLVPQNPRISWHQIVTAVLPPQPKATSNPSSSARRADPPSLADHRCCWALRVYHPLRTSSIRLRAVRRAARVPLLCRAVVSSASVTTRLPRLASCNRHRISGIHPWCIRSLHIIPHAAV